MSNWHGYQGDAGGPLPGSPGAKAALLAEFEEQCRKAQATQAAVPPAPEPQPHEARERALAKAAANQPWSKYPGVLAGDIEGRKKAQEPGAVPPAPEPPAPTPGDFVTGNCNRDVQGALILSEQGRWTPVAGLPPILAGLLYDFAGYLTTRPTVEVGATADPTPVLDRLVEFAKLRCLSLDEANVERWHEALAALALPQVQAGPGRLQREAQWAVRTVTLTPEELEERFPPLRSPLTTVAGLPDGRGKR